jgi:tungstate transport system substrate-binding protein
LNELIVSTTTSLYDSGLLEEIEYDFESNFSIDLHFIPVGTGLAILQGQRGDADVILVHAPEREFNFLLDGHGVARKIIAYNFFIIAGPSNDPAMIKGKNANSALRAILESGRDGNIHWISRGDDSGTHIKEKSLWAGAGYNISLIRNEEWYVESGSGMGSTLRIANEMLAYTLSDIGTYSIYETEGLIELENILSKVPEFLNVYSVIAVNPEKSPDINFKDSITFIEYLVSEKGQLLIEEFGKEKFVESIFSSAANVIIKGSDEAAIWISDFAFLEGSECPIRYRAGQNQLFQ